MTNSIESATNKKLIVNTAAQMMANMNKSQNRFSSGNNGQTTPSIAEKYNSVGAVNNSTIPSNGITGKKNFEPTT